MARETSRRAGWVVSTPRTVAAPPTPGAASARLDPVNRPDLLPKEFTTVIDVAGFLTPSEERRIASEVAALEADTGFKLRVLAQSYPETPGAARQLRGTAGKSASLWVLCGSCSVWQSGLPASSVRVSTPHALLSLHAASARRPCCA